MKTFKNKTIISILFFILPVLMLAQEIKPEDSSLNDKVKSGFLEIAACKGITYPFGEISGDGGQKALFADSEAAGINTGYIVKNNHYLYIGTAFTKMTFEVERTFMEQLMVSSIETTFINLDLSYKYQSKWFYAGFGFYRGFQYSTWSRKNALNGAVTETLLYGDYKSACKDIYGMEVFSGFTFQLNEDCFFNTGLKISIPFNAAYEYDQDAIKVLDAALSASVTQKFAIPFLDKKGF